MPAAPRRSRRSASRSRLRLLVLSLGVLLAVVLGSTVGYQKLKQSRLFAVHHVDVQGGDSQLGSTVQREVLRLVGRRSLLALDSGTLERGIDRLPAVRSSHVDRDFPSSLNVRIVPEQPVAIAVSGHDRVVVSEDGRVLWTIGRRSKPPALPRVGLRGRGVPAPGTYITDTNVRDELRAIAAVPASFGVTVAWARHDPDKGIELDLGPSQLRLYLGRPTQLHDKLAAAELLLQYYPAGEQRRAVHYLDVESAARPAAQLTVADPTTSGGDQSTTDPSESTTSPSTNG